MRHPVAIITPERKIAEQCGQILNIKTLPARGQERSELSEPSREEITFDPPSDSPLRELGILATAQELEDEHAGYSKNSQTPSGDKTKNGKERLDLSHIEDDELRSRVIFTLKKEMGWLPQRDLGHL